MDNGQLTIIGATNVVHFDPSVKVCRERPMCRSGNVANKTCVVEWHYPKVRYKSFPRGKLARLGEPDEGRGAA